METNPPVVLVVLLVVAAGPVAFAEPAVALSSVSVSDSAPQADQTITLTAGARQGASVTFGVDADGNGTITADEMSVVTANSSGIAAASFDLENYSVSEGALEVTADESDGSDYPKTVDAADASLTLTVDTSPPTFDDPRPTSPTPDSTPRIAVDASDAQWVDADSVNVTLRDSRGLLLDSAGDDNDSVSLELHDGYSIIRVNTSNLSEPLAEGLVTVNVSAADPDGQRNSTEWTFTVDTVAPGVWNASLSDGDGDGLVADSDTVSLSVNTSDAHLDRVWVNASAFGAGTVNLSHQTGDTYTGSFTVDDANASSDGTHDLTVRAVDAAGNTNATDAGTLTLDTTAPAFGAPTPPDGSYQDTTTPVIEIPLDDAHGLNATIRVADADGAVVSGSPGDPGVTYVNDTLAVNLTAIDAPLAEGEVTVNASATDATGNRNATNWTFTVDTTAPVVSNASVSDATNANGVVAPSNSLSVEANVTDANGVTVTTNLSAFGAGTATLTHAGGDTYTATVSVTASGLQGAHDVAVTAVDQAGNTNGTVAGTLTYDRTGLSLGNATPTGVVADATANASADLSTAVNDVNASSVDVRVVDANGTVLAGVPGDAGITLENGTLTVDPAAPNASYADGTVTVIVNASDVDGNRGSESWNFTVDTTPPSVVNATLDAGDDDTTTDGEQVTVSVAVADDTLRSVTADASEFGAGTVALTRASGDTYTGTFTTDLSSTTTGQHAVTVAATDAAGHTTTATSTPITIEAQQSSTGGGGGGGGSGGGGAGSTSGSGGGGAGSTGGDGGETVTTTSTTSNTTTSTTSNTTTSRNTTTSADSPAGSGGSGSGSGSGDGGGGESGTTRAGGDGSTTVNATNTTVLGGGAGGSPAQPPRGPGDLGGSMPSTFFLLALFLLLGIYEWRTERDRGPPRL